MKKILCMLCTGLFAVPAFSLPGDDQLLLISSCGDVTYSDGAEVPAGEKYAVVWTKNGSGFSGFNVDGTVAGEDSKLIITLSGRKSKLQPVLMQISREFWNSHSNGVYSLYLLDTRLTDASTRNRDVIRTDSDDLHVFSYSKIASIPAESGTTSDIRKAERCGDSVYTLTRDYTDVFVERPAGESSGVFVPSAEILGVYTNEVTVMVEKHIELTNFVTSTIWHDAIRYTDVTNYFVSTNVVDVTNTVVNTVNATNTTELTRYIDVTNLIDRIVWHDAVRYIDVTNYVVETNVVDVVNIVGATNIVDLTNIVVNTVNITNLIDQIVWHDMFRYVDVLTTNTIVNAVDVTNTVYDTICVYLTNTVYDTKYVVKEIEKPVYRYVTLTNYYDGVFGSSKKAIPTAVSRKKSTYTCLVIDGRSEAGTATIQIGKPNSYGLSKISVKMKIGKKTITDTLYGIIDDEGCVFAYGKDKNDRLVFNGKDVEGFVEYKGKMYEIDGVFTK